MAEPVRARMWEAGGRWYARILDAPAYIEVTGISRRECLTALETLVEDEPLTVEVVPQVIGVAEAAEIMGWDKRRVITYIDRGSFPEPLTSLASGRIWLREDVEAYATQWRARRGQGTS
jgi:predicted DNA-binding transcriptional regulator AlpA